MVTGNTGTPTYDALFTRFDEQNRTGLAVLAIENGVTLFKKGYGLRNLETKAKIDCDTNFRMASVSKQFTAMCVAILEERSKLSIDDGIDQYLADVPDYMKGITIRHLVHHLSGLPDYSHKLCSVDKSKPLITNHDIYDYYKNRKRQKLDSEPGKKYDYSNGGYSLLALVIESAAKVPFPEFMQRAIFEPANMPNSAIITYPSTIKNQAVSYSDWPYFNDIDYNTGNALWGEDGVYTSINDMQGWIHALETHQLVSPEMSKKIFSPTRSNSGKKVEYGYGWGFEKLYKHKVILHGGCWVGFNTIIATVPKRKLWLVAFSNCRS